MPSFTILSTLEHLGSYGDAANVYFGLTLQVASDTLPSTEAERKLLCPWLWDSSLVDDVKILLWKDPGNSAPISAYGTVIRPDDDAELASVLAANRSSVQNSLDTDYQTLVDGKGVSSFAMMAGTYSTSENGQARYRWPAHLAQVTRYPYPIPHSLNLSFFFKVPSAFVPAATPEASVAIPPWFYAAPEFSFKTGAGSDSYQVTAPATQGASLPTSAVVLTYSNTTRGTVTCQTLAIAPTNFIVASNPAAPPSSLSFSDAFVHLHSLEQSNWQDLLVPQCAELFDTSARLLGALRETTYSSNKLDVLAKAAQDAISSHWIVFLRLFVANLYPVGNPGALPSPSLFASQFELWRQANLQTMAADASMNAVEKFRKDLLALLSVPKAVDLSQPTTFGRWCDLLELVPDLRTFRNLLESARFTTSVNDGDTGTPLSAQQLQRYFSQLDGLHVLMTQPGSLSSLLFAQWDKDVTATTKPDAWMTLWSSFRSFLQEQNLRGAVTTTNLLARAVVEQIASAWDPANRNAIRKQIASSLSAEFLKDCGGHAVAAAVSAAFFAPGRSWIETQTAAIVPDDSQATTKQSTTVSEGVTLVLDSLNVRNGHDVLSETSGFCIFGREETTPASAWKCLNVGVVRKPADAPSGTSAVALSLPTVIPVPLHDQDGMRHAMCTYNNQPLMMRSPAASFGENMARTIGSDPASELGLEYVHPYLVDEASLFGKLPGLKFGGTYQFAAARVRSCGALPDKIALSGKPGRLANNLFGDLPYAVKSVSYKRTVPIGALRFGSEGGTTNQPLNVPAIPKDVNPLVNEVLPASDQRSKETFLLLTPYKNGSAGGSNFVFSVRPPAIDLQTWDRYVADDHGASDRINLWADFHRVATIGGLDATLDDPAVKGVSVKLTKLNGPAITGSDTITIAWNLPGNSATLASFRTQARTIEIVADENRATASLNGNIITLPPGGLYRLNFTLQLDAKAAGRLANIGITRQPESLLIETASAIMPLPSDLHTAFTTPLTGSSLAFRLALDPAVKMRNIGHATVATQEWRWNGRPQLWTYNKQPHSGFPFDQISNLDAAQVSEWESVAFAPRQISDATVRTLSRDLSGATSLLVASEDVSPNLGARYFRSFVTAYNRYGSLVPEKNRVVQSSAPDTTSGNQPVRWRRTFVPVRLADDAKLPKPAVKLVLPFTESLAEDAGSGQRDAASLLVSVQGPSFAIAGLAESIEVEVIQLPDGKYQYGPDPKEPVQPNFDAKLKPNIGPLRGPVGHTFDESDINPLWVNSSFVLPPPVLKQGLSARNMFAAIRFRRRLSQAYATAYPKAGALSEWTDTYWVQFLGSRDISTLLDGNAFSDTALSVSGHTLTLVGKTGTPAFQGKLDNPAKTHLQHFLLLTQQVPDLLGRAGQERYVALCEAAADGKSWSIPGKTPVPAAGHNVARILEVEVPLKRDIKGVVKNTAIDTAGLLDVLFAASGSTTDAIARVIGVSPPIFESNMQPCANPGGQP